MSSFRPLLAAPPPPASPGAPLGVVMLLGWNGLGGTQRQALKLSAELRALGARPTVITMRRPDLPRHELVDGVPIHRIGGWPTGRGLRPLTFLGAFLLWSARHRGAFHIVHAHNLPAALTATLVPRPLATPVIVKLPNAVGIEGFRQRRLGALRWSVLRGRVRRFVAVNTEIEQRLVQQGVDHRRIVTIANGVEPPVPVRPEDVAATRHTLGLPHDGPVVAYLGRLVPDKGLAWLLDVWRQVVGEEPRSRLLIIGDGPESQRLQRLAVRLAIAGSVSFLGYRTDVQRLLSLADIVVLPSRSEGMSNALLEAMAYGRAVAATDIPGNRAVVADGEDGLLVEYDHPGALHAALRTLMRDEGLRARLGRAAAAKARTDFSIRAIATRYEELYRDVLKQRGRRAVLKHSVVSAR